MGTAQLTTLYLAVVNVVAFCLYGVDKRRAVKEQWRISEAALLGIAFLGGSLGALLAMYLLRHKTRRWKFKLLIPAFFVLQAAFFIGLFFEAGMIFSPT